jgi:putative thioredoxin
MLAASRIPCCTPRVAARMLSTAAPAASGTSAVVEIRSNNDFEQMVVQASQQAPPVGGAVIVDFYADWCEPCKTLTPKLEALVAAAQGAVRLAKINVDALPEIAQAMQVKSLPTVAVIHKGKLVDSFTGVQPEAQVKAFVEKAVQLSGGAGSGKRALEEAEKLLEGGELGGATQLYGDLLGLPEHAAPATAGLAMCALADDNLALAQELVAELHAKHASSLNSSIVRKAISKVGLAGGTDGDGRPVAGLEALLAADPADHAARYELAQALLGRSEHEAAVGELLHIIKKDRAWNEGAPKALLFQVFDSLGSDSDVVKGGRRKLSNILLM